MSYFEKTKILAADSPSIDAFGKWRVSNPTTLFDSKQIADSGSFYFDIQTVNSATVEWNSGSAQSTLSVTATSGSRAIKQTKRLFVYQPGKSQQIILTGKFGIGVDGIKKTIGSFNEKNGLMFQQSGSSFGIVLRKTINNNFTDTFISQSNWNIDKLNGSGPSGNILDLNKAQIFTVDYEWLGVGRVRFGVVQKGMLVYVHEFDHYNDLDNVYLRNPNLPIRYEISTHHNASSTSELNQICSTVISEGGFSNTGRRTLVQTELGIPISGNAYEGVLFVRYAPNTNGNDDDIQSIPEKLSFLVEPGNNSPFSGRWSLLINPQHSGSLSWTNTGIGLQMANFPSGSAITNEGTAIACGYFAGTGGSGTSSEITLDPQYGLGRKIDGTSDILTLAIKSINNNYAIHPTLVMRELD